MRKYTSNDLLNNSVNWFRKLVPKTNSENWSVPKTTIIRAFHKKNLSTVEVQDQRVGRDATVNRWDIEDSTLGDFQSRKPNKADPLRVAKFQIVHPVCTEDFYFLSHGQIKMMTRIDLILNAQETRVASFENWSSTPLSSLGVKYKVDS